MDSGRVSTGMMVLNNFVYNIGSLGSSAALCLDGETSWMTVANNIFAGPGQYGFIIHGGNNNIFYSNIIDASSLATLALYQDDWGIGGLNYGMAGNVFSHNIVYSNGAVPGWWILNQTEGNANPAGNIVNPSVSDNLYYSAVGVYEMTVLNALVSGSSANGVYTTVELNLDSNPQYGNPLFVDPQANNYALQPGSPAYNVGFVPTAQ